MNLRLFLISASFLFFTYDVSLSMMISYNRTLNKTLKFNKKNSSIANDQHNGPSLDDFNFFHTQTQSLLPKELMQTIATAGDRITKSRLRETCHLYKQYLTIGDNPTILKTL